MAGELALSSNSPTKTFVLEAHADDPAEYVSEVFGRNTVENTKDAYLYKIHVDNGIFWVDQLDERFWNIHTDMPAQAAWARIRNEVEARRELDWIWLPSDHLRNLWPDSVAHRVSTSFGGRRLVGSNDAASDLKVQLSGQNANELLDYISENPRYRSSVSFHSVQTSLADADLGSISEGVNRMGRFAVSGDSFEFHTQFVRTVVQRYKGLVEACERRALAFERFDPPNDDCGGTFEGSPIAIRFSRNIEDLPSFLSELLSSRQPYRLWGIPEIDGDHAEIEAVDLHIGHRLRIDVGTSWLRVYIDPDCCGNTVARLVTNLQHTFDSALRFVDPELQAALVAENDLLVTN
jgi:hypothetical protein